MTSTNARIGGFRKEVDYQKPCPALLIAASLVLAVRTARWPATHSDGLADVDWQRKLNIVPGSQKSCSHMSPLVSQASFLRKMCLGIRQATTMFPAEMRQ